MVRDPLVPKDDVKDDLLSDCGMVE